MYKFFCAIFLFFLIGTVSSQKKCSDPKAEYLTCKRCVGSCDNLHPVCTASCEPAGCYCKKNFVRRSDTDDTCVPPSTCFNCGNNEEYNDCGSACPLTCENKDNPPICTEECVEGCFCKSGYVRNTIDGKCVLPKNCPAPKCTKPNQVYSECGANGCQNTCKNPTFAQVCKGPCIAGCVCKEGYLKNSNGDCVLPKDCKECGGDKEVWTECDNNSCQRNCDTFGLTNIACKPICTPGCICERGYVRNSDGVCVSPPDCGTNICPEPNTEYTDCVPCDNTCEIYATNATCNFLVCNVGCTCKAGFYLNAKSQCVPPNQCDYCKENAEFSECDNHPCRNICSDPKFSTSCKYDNTKCYPGCICKEGYLEDNNGNCVPEENCKPKCDDPNAFYNGCGNTCALTCKNKDDPPVCPAVCRPENAGCECNPGYAFDSKGVCIKVEDCPQSCTDPNEKYYGCKPCKYTCENPSFSCAAVCVSGCECKNGYIRKSNNDDTCVPKNSCPTCPANESYKSCGTACPLTCENKDNPPQFCTDNCVEGCFCNDGYVRDTESGNCVKPNKCPPPKCPKPNEEYSECGANACQNTCARPNNSLVCKAACKSGCVCKEGYLKNSNGDCVLPKDCKECGDANEVWTECDNNSCIRDCDNFGLSNITCDSSCTPGCICKFGFVRNSNGVCVSPPDCGTNLCPEPNTEYTDCVPCDNTCEIRATTGICLVFACNVGCTCKAGYFRNSRSQCVLPEQCDYCKTNAVFSECGNHPCRDTCENPTLSTRCKYDTTKCYPGCICEPGFLKNSTGDCVPKNTCGKSCPDNEKYEFCGTACPITCENKDNPPSTCTANCVEGCFCNEGYVRDTKSGKCVLPDNCPTPTCPANEVFQSCGTACPTTCENKDNPSTICTFNCVTGCFCKGGFVRDTKSGKCVQPSKCPAPTCPANEVFKSCGTACPITCENKDNPPKFCTKNCVVGCFCKEGFVRDTESGKCVKPNKCPAPTCPANEEYNSCGTACPITCKNKDNPPNKCTRNCVPGCFCKKGYVRDEDSGKCVRPNKCPAPKCPGPYETYSKCDANPCLDNCEEPDFSTRCVHEGICYPGCICIKGYLRNVEGNCVPEKECPPKCKDPNEIFYRSKPCKYTCDRPSFSCAAVSVPGCECKEGYIRKSDKDDTCIPINSCPKKCKDPNSEYLTCKRCVGSCDDRNPICDKSCKPAGCYCKKGYIKKSKTDSTCIKESACPTTKPTCKKNEIWCENCLVVPETCEDYANPKKGKKPGCCCKPGYIREYIGGSCIREENCDHHYHD